MLIVVRVHLPSEIPIVGCEITPYVLLRRPDGSVSTDDVTEAAPVDGCFIRYKWIRIQNDRKVMVCSVHPTEQATLQCLGCTKAKIPVARSYHCTPKCFADAWQHHRVLHDRAAKNDNGHEDDESFGRANATGSGVTKSVLSNSTTTLGPSPGSVNSPFCSVTDKVSGETWIEISRSRTYTPTIDDIGNVLRFECSVIDADTNIPVGAPTFFVTSRVIPAPTPIPRKLIPVNGLDVLGHVDFSSSTSSLGTFTVLSYNILADSCATSDAYSYCPSWALSWSYRRQNLLQEIVAYHPDVICLQEVQSNHFTDFFQPELEKQGYQALYKKRSLEVYSGDPMIVEGCATFYRNDRFTQVKKYEVEFNKAAQSLTDAVIPNAQKKLALNRLIKDNVALIAVLEAKSSNPDSAGKRQLLCVANTHLNVHYDLKDVKLWQVHTLLKGLEKIAMSADIPMLLCGDFNSLPGSAPHTLLAVGKVDHTHPDLIVDPLGILRPPNKLSHQLPLVSAYSSFARAVGAGIDLERQRRRMDSSSNEPLFTNCTRDWIGTVDYIFYTADSLTVESLLELFDEESLRKDTALPSPEWSSDHIALLGKFRYNPRTRR